MGILTALRTNCLNGQQNTFDYESGSFDSKNLPISLTF